MRNDFCSNFLEHSAKGTTWKNVKYVAKVKLASGKYFYFYDQRQYQNYLKRRNQVGTAKAQVELSKQPAKRTVSTTSQNSSASSTSSSLKNYANKTTEEKKAATNNYINEGKAASTALTATASSATVSSGKTKAQELLERARAKADSSSSKKKGSSSSSSSKSSKSSSGSKSKGSASSKSSKDSTGSKSTKSSSSTKGASSKENTTKTTSTANKKLQADERAFTTDSLKKLYGIKDSDVNTHESTDDMMDTLKSYKDGAFGYIVAGDKTYKWVKEGGNIVFKDFTTDKEVTLSSALNNIQEFRTDKKNKK